jgi:hypothetical protein
VKKSERLDYLYQGLSYFPSTTEEHVKREQDQMIFLNISPNQFIIINGIQNHRRSVTR